MKINVIKKILLILLINIFALTIKCYAGSFSITVTPTTVEPNSKVTIKITGNNATGRINLSGSNISLSSSSVWGENNTQTVTGTVTGANGSKATITATPAVDNLVDSTTADTIAGAKSATVIIKKEEPKQETTTQTTPTVNTNTNNTTNNNSSNNSSKPVTNSNSNSSSKPTTTTTNSKNTTKNNTSINKKEEAVQNEYIEDQGTVSEFGITSLYVHTINEKEEKSEIEISPKFDINTSEYKCSVSANIKRVEIIYEANEYNDLVKIEGLENDLISGENNIIIRMNDNNRKEKIYKILVTKDIPEVVETISEDIIEDKIKDEKKDAEKKIIKMPVIWFVVLQLSIIVINILISITIYQLKKKKWMK